MAMRGKQKTEETQENSSPADYPTVDESGAITQARIFTTEQLQGLETWDQAVALVQSTYGGEIVKASRVIGDGFALLDNKDRLLDIPLILLEWSFSPGDFGREMVTVRLVARNPGGVMTKYIINDGSTGLATELREYSDKTSVYGGLGVTHGLRKSDYTYCALCQKVVQPSKDTGHAEEGAHTKGSTYYLNTTE